MINQMKRCIAKWERSGQGKGGNIEPEDIDEEQDGAAPVAEPQFRLLSNRSETALDSRHSFFHFQQTYLMYFWHMLDKHTLFGTSLLQLDKSGASSNGGTAVPSEILGQACQVGSAEDDGKSLDGLLTCNTNKQYHQWQTQQC
jgi:hypothetical protein